MIEGRDRMRDEILRVINGDADGIACHGPSTRSNLSDVTAERAAARPVAGSHSIWELVVHLKVGREWSLARLGGSKPDVEWWPETGPQGPEAWESLLRSLDDVRDEFLRILQTASNDEDRQAAVRFLIHHELYHSGQIALLRKALGMPGRPG